MVGIINTYTTIKVKHFTIILLLPKHKLLHLPMHGGDLLTHNHRQQLQSEADGFLNQEALALKHKVYRKTHSLYSPSDRRGKQHLDNLRQKAYYEQRVEDLLSLVLSEPILLGIQVHRQYLHGKYSCSLTISIFIQNETYKHYSVKIATAIDLFLLQHGKVK